MIKLPTDYIEQGLKFLLTDNTKKRINTAATIKEVPKCTTVLLQGEIPKELCFIVKGIMRGYYLDEKGNDTTKCFETEGGIVCSEGLRKNGFATFGVESIEDCFCVFIPYKIIKLCLSEDILLRNKFEEYSLQSLSYYEKREQELLTLTGLDRYLNFKKEFGKIEDRISLAHIASYIGIRPSSLSRLRRHMK